MPKLRLGTSYWLDRYSGRIPRFGTMRGRHRADIAIVGGGITGCVAAYLFARAGARVVLVEARRIGRGQHRGEHGAADAGARRRPRATSRRATASGTAAACLEAQPRVGARVRPAPRATAHRRRTAAHAVGLLDVRPAGLAGSCAVSSPRRHAAGIPGRWLSPAALKRATGIDGAGGILTRGNAQVDPYRSCLGVAQAARARRRAAVRTVGGEARDGRSAAASTSSSSTARSTRIGRSSPPDMRRRSSSRSPAGSG